MEIKLIAIGKTDKVELDLLIKELSKKANCIMYDFHLKSFLT